MAAPHIAAVCACIWSSHGHSSSSPRRPQGRGPFRPPDHPAPAPPASRCAAAHPRLPGLAGVHRWRVCRTRHAGASMSTICKDGDLAVITREEPGLEANVGRLLGVYGPVLEHPELGAVWEPVPATDEPMAFL